MGLSDYFCHYWVSVVCDVDVRNSAFVVRGDGVTIIHILFHAGLEGIVFGAAGSILANIFDIWISDALPGVVVFCSGIVLHVVAVAARSVKYPVRVAVDGFMQ
jgi:hypothetical protein